VTISTTHGVKIIPLIPLNYQWSLANPTAPTFRISGISWDASPLRDDQGRRIRQKAVISVVQFTPVTIVLSSATKRSVQRNSSTTQKKKAA
jgi:hypothetical protein